MWRKSRLKLVENKKNDLIWLILHRAVKVRYSLKVWGYKVKSDRCAVCSKPETIKHCFLACPRSRRVWGFFAPFLTRLEGSAFPSPFLLFSTLSLIPSLPPVFPFLLTLRRLCCTGSGMLGT